jgi:hypothetical protein
MVLGSVVRETPIPFQIIACGKMGPTRRQIDIPAIRPVFMGVWIDRGTSPLGYPTRLTPYC